MKVIKRRNLTNRNSKMKIYKNKMQKSIVNSEYVEQRNFVEWLEIMKTQKKVILFSAVPHDTFTKSWKVKNKNRYLGVRKGVPDLLIIVKNKKNDYELVFIEMKKEKGGVLSLEQKEWIENLNRVKKVEAECCKGFDEAKKFIDNIIKKV